MSDDGRILVLGAVGLLGAASAMVAGRGSTVRLGPLLAPVQRPFRWKLLPAPSIWKRTPSKGRIEHKRETWALVQDFPEPRPPNVLPDPWLGELAFELRSPTKDHTVFNGRSSVAAGEPQIREAAVAVRTPSREVVIFTGQIDHDLEGVARAHAIGLVDPTETGAPDPYNLRHRTREAFYVARAEALLARNPYRKTAKKGSSGRADPRTSPLGWTAHRSANGWVRWTDPKGQITVTDTQRPTRYQLSRFETPTILVEGRRQPTGRACWVEYPARSTWKDAWEDAERLSRSRGSTVRLGPLLAASAFERRLAQLPFVSEDTDEQGRTISFYAVPFPYRRTPKGAAKGPVVHQEIPLDPAQLWASQKTVTDRGLRKHAEPPRFKKASEKPHELPFVYREPDGTFTISDGHHRIVAAWLRGETTMLARVQEVSGVYEGSSVRLGPLFPRALRTGGQRQTLWADSLEDAERRAQEDFDRMKGRPIFVTEIGYEGADPKDGPFQVIPIAIRNFVWEHDEDLLHLSWNVEPGPARAATTKEDRYRWGTPPWEVTVTSYRVEKGKGSAVRLGPLLAPGLPTAPTTDAEREQRAHLLVLGIAGVHGTRFVDHVQDVLERLWGQISENARQDLLIELRTPFWVRDPGTFQNLFDHLDRALDEAVPGGPAESRTTQVAILLLEAFWKTPLPWEATLKTRGVAEAFRHAQRTIASVKRVKERMPKR